MDTQHTQPLDRPRRVPVTDPIAAERRYDYADAFEAQPPSTVRCTPEQWVAAGFDNTGPFVRWIVRRLGMDTDTDDPLAGWRVVESTPEVLHLEQSDALMDTTLIGRNLASGRRVMTTVLSYHRPALARVIWSLVGIMHRRTAKKMVTTVPPEPTADNEAR